MYNTRAQAKKLEGHKGHGYTVLVDRVHTYPMGPVVCESGAMEDGGFADCSPQCQPSTRFHEKCLKRKLPCQGFSTTDGDKNTII